MSKLISKMLWLAGGAIVFHEITERGATEGLDGCLLTVRGKDHDLDADLMLELGQAMVRSARRIKDAT